MEDTVDVATVDRAALTSDIPGDGRGDGASQETPTPRGDSSGRQKHVPYWLNNPLWSSPPATPAQHHPLSEPPASPPPEQDSPSPPLHCPLVSDSSLPPEEQPTSPHRHHPATSDRLSDPLEPNPLGRPSGISDPLSEEREDEDDGDAKEEEIVDENSRQLAEFRNLLLKTVVDMGELRRLACRGVPDEPGVRPLIWKLLLGYLPRDHALWESELEKKRCQYNTFKDELLLNPSEATRRMDESSGSKSAELESEGVGVLSRLDITNDDHPLSLGKTSVWNKYFQESETIEQIERDVKRTHPEVPFFSEDSSYSRSNQDSLKRILTLFAKLNPGIRYVQGMNEIVALIFYVFKTDSDQDSADSAEADAFFCFIELLSGFRDNFCKQLDNSEVGIRAMIDKLSLLLKRHDEELWRHLEIINKVNPQFYAFRWITLLLTQEFELPGCVRIWDYLLSDPDGHEATLLRICCAMIMLVKRPILAGDFMANLKLLQNYPPIDIDLLLHVANKLREHPLPD